MSNYTHTTLIKLKNQLAARLGDPENAFWSDAELGLYIREALQTWGGLSLYWRDRGLLETEEDVAFYNLAELPVLGQSMQDVDLAEIIEYHLLEPPSVGAWEGTDQFSLEDLLASLQRKLDQFFLESGVRASHVTLAGPSPGNGRLPMPEAVVDVRRVSWIPITGTSQPLFVGDSKEFDALRYRWSLNPGDPVAYSILSEPPLTIQLAPVPSGLGQLSMVVIETGDPLSFEEGVVLGIPEDLSWVVKWGALADLLAKDGPSKDSQRAEYCQQRWEEGVLAAKMYPSILRATVSGIQVPMASLLDLDSGVPSWESSSGTPTSVAVVNHNLIALYPIPSGIFGVELDVVSNAPIPEADNDPIQVGREHLTTILDYAHHLAAFKMGGAEFFATMPLYQNFMKSAMELNDRLRARAQMFESLRAQTAKEEAQNPRQISA